MYLSVFQSGSPTCAGVFLPEKTNAPATAEAVVEGCLSTTPIVTTGVTKTVATCNNGANDGTAGKGVDYT